MRQEALGVQSHVERAVLTLVELTNLPVIVGLKDLSLGRFRKARDYPAYLLEKDTAFFVVIRARPRVLPDQDSWSGDGWVETRGGCGPETSPATGET